MVAGEICVLFLLFDWGLFRIVPRPSRPLRHIVRYPWSRDRLTNVQNQLDKWGSWLRIAWALDKRIKCRCGSNCRKQVMAMNSGLARPVFINSSQPKSRTCSLAPLHNVAAWRARQSSGCCVCESLFKMGQIQRCTTTWVSSNTSTWPLT